MKEGREAAKEKSKEASEREEIRETGRKRMEGGETVEKEETGGNHGSSMKECRDRGRASHGIRKPRMEKDLSRFSHRSEKEKEEERREKKRRGKGRRRRIKRRESNRIAFNPEGGGKKREITKEREAKERGEEEKITNFIKKEGFESRFSIRDRIKPEVN